MSDFTKKEKELRAAGVRYLFGAYVDIHGVPKSKTVPLSHFKEMMKGSELYTVGALEGMGPLGPNEDECVGIPDATTLTILPWDSRYAVAAADLTFHGQPYDHDSRWVLHRQIAAADDMGYIMNMGVEPEVYVLQKREGNWIPFVLEDLLNAPTRGYDIETTILADPFLDPMVEHINALGWDVYSFDHEGGDGQYEFDFGYTDALTMCFRMILFRLMAKHVARSIGCIASFMPKPWPDAFGSGAHMNVSLADKFTGKNMFKARSKEEAIDKQGYTKLAYQFTAGVLRHFGSITAVVCPTTNSYKRMVPYGRMREMSWAPVYRAWGHNNRTLIARLPINRYCLEVRQADSACNFYLGSAMVLAAGLEGIREDLDPGEAVDYDTYTVNEPELEARGILRVPRTLGEALESFKSDPLSTEVFGESFHSTFLEYKQAEWNEYCLDVSQWERDRYLQLW
ncbi:MAG: type III glutamate--ammonia ligase [Pseudomonadota bacterium]|nr:type III glutamate--ammonia ligase [Pseudomonadota bacterium]